jgi:hypothetical protein
MTAKALDIDSIIERLLAVRGSRPGKQVQVKTSNTTKNNNNKEEKKQKNKKNCRFFSFFL